jgi:hypothetical protein
LAIVHLFISTGRFTSLEEMRHFIEQTYTEDGDGLDSAFMLEVGLDDGYEPGCIETYCQTKPIDLRSLLEGASYAHQWVHLVPQTMKANAAICVFEPNRMRTPEKTSLTYVGVFSFDVPANSQW